MDKLKQQLAGTARIKIFMGEFGSGKTEFAVNYALKLKAQGLDTAIVDLDLVKPYFRVRENRALLERKAVKVVAAADRLSDADLPIMPQDLTRVLCQQERQVIIDVGGYKGAIVLGQLRNNFSENHYEALLVVNTRRPFTDCAEGIIKVIEDIENVSRLKFTGLISNTNLTEETTVDHIMEGISILEEVSNRTGLPINWVVVPKELAETVSDKYPVFLLERYTHYPWMELNYE